MKPAPFDYRRATTVDEAVSLLAQAAGEARLLAGGQSLVPLMNFRLARPRCLVDINGIGELDYIRQHDGVMTVGALTRQSTFERSESVARYCPILVEATRLIGHPAIRHRGTIGGCLAHADPCAEYPAVLVALGGEVVVRGPTGQRTVPAGDLFVSFCTTSLAADEMITEVRLPVLRPGSGWAFVELNRRHGDFALVGAAAVLSADRAGVCVDARIALCGVGPTPMRCTRAEAILKGSSLDQGAIDDAAHEAQASTEATDDIHASADYRRAMAGVLVGRALHHAIQRLEH